MAEILEVQREAEQLFGMDRYDPALPRKRETA
jgi:hypothetical protein